MPRTQGERPRSLGGALTCSRGVSGGAPRGGGGTTGGARAPSRVSSCSSLSRMDRRNWASVEGAGVERGDTPMPGRAPVPQRDTRVNRP